ncbi:EAL domain-containing protein/glycosyl transferase [Halomicronema hongdechloris C2206]|uniref:EAL domain-containing protein/glycosyl transferase n=1 Tax=Halomicronema hongdechloris C2206 TaxID=1641165 RepID=A0A1Z3HMJ4_9CYAN|nr:glycosyltransferase family 2 protein [Halomicronema hongdechloris]ASC71541.1 EAL domain-containing protein/glycosyl transferase [Halomicronema hongdechloris C2206]
MSDPVLSAIICTHNRAGYLGAAIDSLLAQTWDDYEVIVVDNASTDDTRAVVQARCSHLRLHYVYEATLGLSAARNRGTTVARGQILAYLDDDAEASANWLQALYRVYAANPRVAIAGGKVTLALAAGPIGPGLLSENLMGHLGAYDLGDELHYITQPGLTPRGLNYSLRRSFLDSMGGFDLALARVGTNLLSNEELYMTQRALADGWQVAYVPTALVAHNVAPERLHPRWFLRRSWWQGISEFHRERLSGQRRHRWRQLGERLVRGLYKTLKYSFQPAARFENAAYVYGQLGYLSQVLKAPLTAASQRPTPEAASLALKEGNPSS